MPWWKKVVDLYNMCVHYFAADVSVDIESR